MQDLTRFYINGGWVSPTGTGRLAVENPATEQAVAQIALGNQNDVDRAVAAARDAFLGWSTTSREQRLRLLEQLLAIYLRRYDEMAQAISIEMGAPMTLAKRAQAETGRGHLQATIEILRDYLFEEDLGNSRVVREPVGVCGLITPWNWPLNQITCKVAPALAAGCTMVLKPSEITPLSAHLFTEMVDEAGFPKGVFNLVDGYGPEVGAALASHPDVDMMSFTGSTRAGTAVSKAAADTVKRVALELGGKSPHLVLDDADLEKAVKWNVFDCFSNTGQSCNAPTRMLAPRSHYEKILALAEQFAAKVEVGDPSREGRHIGPLASKKQFETVQHYIQKGVEEGARLLCGGLGKPDGFDVGYYVKPTIFADVNNSMSIAREEIFGPVLVIIPYDTEEEGIAIANDTPYGLSGYVFGELEHARSVAGKIRAGMVSINGAHQDYTVPFGGYKQSGIGREWGKHGFEEFMEVKAVNGYK